MKRKRVVLSAIAGMLCLVGMFAGFITNGLNHTHAEQGLQANTTQRNSTKSAQSTVRSEDVIQGNIYYGSRGTSVYALNAFTGELIWKYPHASSLATVTNGIAYVTSSSGSLVALKGTDGKVLWQYQGSLVTVTNRIAYVTSSSDTLVALQAFTGSLIWSYQISSDFLWSPLIVNNSVYLSANDGLYALEASHGSLLWHYQTSQVFGPPFSPAPLFAHSTIYIVTFGGTYPACYNLVSALKATDGSLLWSYKVDCTEAGLGGATVSFVKGKVLVRGLGDYWYQQISFLDPIKGSVIYSHNMYVEFHDFFLIDGVIYFTDYTHVYAVRLSDGTVLWSYQPVDGSDRIEVVDQIVYVFEGIYETGPMTAHKATDGSLLWSMQPAPSASVTGSNNTVYIFEGGTTTARKATDGALLWSYQGTCGWFGGIVNGTIYLNGCPIYALHASNGTLLWSSGITGWIERIINGFLYVTEQSTGILYVLDASNGTQVWSSGKAASISTVVNQIVYVISSSGTVYALDATNGTQLWSY
jgi:outer membrane protein assembly factor BamB